MTNDRIKKYRSEEGSRSQGTEHFAALNSGRGFICYYREVFGDAKIKKRYIIKGGPGTGKSSFMKRMAAQAEAHGKTVDRYRCSSDPDSLDGIIIDGETAFLDGTAPHIYEPNISGAEDEIVNLGMFWNSDKLYESYNRIATLSAMRSSAYSKAYRFLGAAMNVEEINRALVSPARLMDKMNGAVARIMKEIPDGTKYSAEYGFINAIGMKGRAHLPTYESVASKLYSVYDCYGIAGDVLCTVLDYAVEKRLRVRISYSPLVPSLPDALLLIESGVAFVISDGEEIEGEIKLNAKRFIDESKIARIKSEYRQNLKLKNALLDSAVEALSEAGVYHFELEDIYVKCMDFQAESQFINSFCEKII